MIKIHQPFSHSSISNIFSIYICVIWNALLQDVVDASSLNSFKNRLDRHWCMRAFRFLYDCNGFEELFLDMLSFGPSGNHYTFQSVFIIGRYHRYASLYTCLFV